MEQSKPKPSTLRTDVPSSQHTDVKAFPIHDDAHDAFMTLPRYTLTREVIITSDELLQQKERSSMNMMEKGSPNHRSQSSTSHAGHGLDETESPERPALQRRLVGNTWRRLRQWVRSNTFAPSWLPARLRHPALGYLAAVMLGVIAVALTVLLKVVMPAFSLLGVLVILGVVVVALNWGGSPSLLATLVSTALLSYAAFSPRFSWSIASVEEAVSVGLVLVVGMHISLVVGRAARRSKARQEAEMQARVLRETQTQMETFLAMAGHELKTPLTYIKQPLPQDVYKRSPLYKLGTTLGPGIGMAGFFSSDGDNLRHATVGSKEDNTDNILHEIVWNAQVHPSARNLATQFHLRDVVGIAGFFDLDVHSRDVIVAMMGGDVYDVRYSGGTLGGEQITTVRITTFSPTLDNVAAFVNTNTKVAHVIVLDKSWQLYDYTYTPHHEGLGQMTPLKNIANLLPPGPPGTRGIKDIVAYYSYYDSYCHVIVATSDGNLHEIYYYGQ